MPETRILIGMPVYGGKPEWETAQSWSAIERNPGLIPGTRLIMAKERFYSAGTSRNRLIAAAERYGCSKVLLVDSDVVFGPAHVARIVSHNEPIVGGIYPKRIAERLEWATAMDRNAIRPEGLCPVLNDSVAAGFLCIDMAAIGVMKQANPGLRYLWKQSDASELEMYHLFGEAIVDRNGSPRWLGEDVNFCRLASLAGIPVYADTKCVVGHVGTVDFLRLHEMIENRQER